MKKSGVICLIFVGLFLVFTQVSAAISYTRTPAGAAEASPVAISVSVDSFSDFGFLEPPLTQAWNVIAEGDNNEVHGACLLFSELSYSESMTFPSDVYYRVFAQGYNSLENCQNNTASTGGYDLEGDGSETILTISDASTPASGSSQRGMTNVSPQVTLQTEIAGTYRGVLSFNYSVFDPDAGQAALKPQPMTFMYCDETGKTCETAATDQLYTGTYDFDTAKIPDGNYKIRVVAQDSYDFGHAFSEIISIDNTPPFFNIAISPASPVKELTRIALKISASENLKQTPKVSITQEGASPASLEVTGNGREFSASYQIVRGHRGKAVIAVWGEDSAGNIGEIITSGKSFSVERYGPPAPIINYPADNQIFTDPIINLFGTAELNTKISVTLNGITEFAQEVSSGGSFKIDNISLSSSTQGYNTFSIFSINEKGEESEETVLKVKLNSPPKIAIASSFEKILSGEKEITWTASDANADKLIFSMEYSNDDGVTWDIIVADLATTSYNFDTTELADGSNYLLRVSADDGTEKVSSSYKKFVIKNNLPHISLNIPKSYFTNINTPKITGTVTSPQNLLAGVTYSFDQGQTWQKAKAIDGAFNSLDEGFEINVTTPLPDAKYLLLIKAEDAFYRSVKISRTINIDTTPPADPAIKDLLEKPVTSAMDANSLLAGQQIVFQGQTEPEIKLELALQGQNFMATSTKTGEFKIADVTLPTHGLNQFSLSSFDRAGNTSKMTGTIALNNPPQVSDLTLTEGEFMGGVREITWQMADADNDPLSSEIFYQKETGNWVKVEGLDFSKIPNGAGRVKIAVSDGISTTENIVNVLFDNVYPKGVLNTQGPLFTNNTKPSFSGQATDDFSGIEYVEYSFDNKAWYKAVLSQGYQTLKADFEFQHRFPLEDGSYQVGVKITDRAGNVAYLEPQSLTIDTTPPRIGSNVISSGSLILFPDEDGITRLLGNTDYKILLAVEGEAEEVVLKSGETTFNLVLNPGTSLWESQINFKVIGDFSLEISARDQANNAQTKEIAKLKVVPQGYVYNEKNNQPVAGAKVALYVFDESANSWLLWDGAAFSEENPQETPASGEYGFLVPPGKYRLEVSSRGFDKVKSQELETARNYLITSAIPLAESRGIFNKILDLFR